MAKEVEKTTATKPAKKNKKAKGNGKFTRFFKDLRSETKKVVWPSKKQVKNNTVAVLAFAAVAAVFVWVLDFVFTNIVSLVLG